MGSRKSNTWLSYCSLYCQILVKNTYFLAQQTKFGVQQPRVNVKNAAQIYKPKWRHTGQLKLSGLNSIDCCKTLMVKIVNVLCCQCLLKASFLLTEIVVWSKTRSVNKIWEVSIVLHFCLKWNRSVDMLPSVLHYYFTVGFFYTEPCVMNKWAREP